VPNLLPIIPSFDNWHKDQSRLSAQVLREGVNLPELKRYDPY